MESIGIVGAGITGLTSAYFLEKAGFSVTVYEKSPRAGGVIRSYREGPWLAEEGPHTLLETSPVISQLINELGIEPERFYANEASKKRFIVRNKKPIPLPASPVSFLKTDLFSLKAKLRLFKEPFIKPWDNRSEESLAHFVERRLGKEFLDYAINPFVAGVYAGDPKNLSVKQAFEKLYELEQKYGSLIKGQIKGAKERKQRQEVSKQKAQLLSFKDGLETIPKAIFTHLSENIELNSTVNKIRRNDEGWEIVINKNGNELKRKHDKILYCGPVHHLPELNLENSGNSNLADFTDVYYPPVSVLTLGFQKEQVDHPLDGFGMLIPQKESFHILGTLFTSTLFPGRAPEGYVTLASFIGGARNPGLAESDTQKLLETTLKDLDIMLGIKGQPEFIHHIFWEHAIPQYQIGYGLIKERMNQIEMLNPGFYLAGNYRNGISVSDCIVSGHDTAGRISEKVI